MAGRWNGNCRGPSVGDPGFSGRSAGVRKVHCVAQASFRARAEYGNVGDASRTDASGSAPNARYESLADAQTLPMSFVQEQFINQMFSNNMRIFTPTAQNDDTDVERIANHIQGIWATWKQSQVLTDCLRHFFQTSSNPYVSLLKLINVISEDRSKGKASTMIYTITEEFYKWIKHDSEYEHVFLTDELKILAFKMVLEKRICLNTINIIVKIFKCNTQLDTMEELIRESIKQKKFKEACYASMSLNIQDRFTVEDFLIPMFFTNLLSVSEEFLASSKYQQQALVKYFDDLLVENDDCLYQLANRLNVTPTTKSFSNKGQLKTNLTRIMKKYNISNEFAPNITRQKKKGALKFMFHRYQSGVTGIDGWREMVLESVGSDKDMMLEVVKMLDNYGDIQEGVYFAQLFSIDPCLLPPCIQHEFSENASAGIEKSIPFEDYRITQYYELSLSDEQIHIIDSDSKFRKFLDKINVGLFEANFDVLGLDCEWKPELTHHKSDLASIQLATVDAIYIFHLPQLQPAEHFKLHWQEFAMNIFSNINVLKLGFEWKGDASMIKSTLPVDNVQLHGPGFIDMKLLWKELETKWNFQLPYQNYNEGVIYNSLSDLVKLCFGKPLNKTEQFSNWEKIPLRANQIKYAALDAFCLLEIYNVFKTTCLTSNIPFEEICQRISNNNHSETTKPKPKQKKQKNKVPTTNTKTKSPHFRISSVEDFKLLIPNTLEKLAKRLRKCGIDTSIVDRSKINDCQYLVNEIKSNNLHFIAYGHVYSKVAEQLNEGKCYCVQNHSLDDQLQEVLNYFRIVVKKENLNSRCQSCNSNNYEIVSSIIMKQIYDNIKNLQNKPVVKYRTPSTDEDDDCDDGFYYGDDYSEDEGSGAPINYVYNATQCSTNFSAMKPEEPHSKLLSGYTNENWEINIKPLSPEMFNDKNRVFNICNSCGSVSWDNSQWESALGSSVGMKY